MAIFTDWNSQHTLLLCQHVLQHGPEQWHQLALELGVTATLCALKWHGIHLGRVESVYKALKNYSDWELCVLFVAGHPTGGAVQLSKKAIYTELSKWLPGRSAEGLRQAYAHNVAGHDAKYLAKLQANSWPFDLTALLAAWPGPSPTTQAVLDAEGVEGHKAAAAQVLQELSTWEPLAKKSRLSTGVAAAASAADPSAISAAPSGRSHVKAVRRVYSTSALGTVPSVGRSSNSMRLSPNPEYTVAGLGQLQLHNNHNHQPPVSRVQSQPRLLGQQQQQQQPLQLPVMGLDAFAGTAADAHATDLPVLQDGTPGAAAATVGISMFDEKLLLPAMELDDLAAQIAADLAAHTPCASPCASSSTNPAAFPAATAAVPDCGSAPAALAAVPCVQSGTFQGGILDSHQDLLQLLGVHGFKLSNAAVTPPGFTQHQGQVPFNAHSSFGPVTTQLDTTAEAGGVAFAAVAAAPELQQQPAGAETPTVSRAPAVGMAPAPVAAAPAVLLHGSQPSSSAGAAAGGVVEVSTHELRNLMSHIQKVDQQQQVICTMLVGIKEELDAHKAHRNQSHV